MKLFRRGLIKLALPLSCGLGLVAALFAQRPFHQYPSVEYGESIPLPSDWQRPGEWAFARLMYPPGPDDGYRGRLDGDWRQGISLWTQDFPPADRHALAVRRLTRIDARSVEQDVNLDEGDAYDWPWLYAVQVGEWGLTDSRPGLREYCCAAASSWPTISTAMPNGRVRAPHQARISGSPNRGGPG